MRVYPGCSMCGRPLVGLGGPETAQLGIIGERPGDVEKARLEPFVGPSGALLRAELLRVGIHLENCRVTNIWRHDPIRGSDEVAILEYAWHLQNALEAVAKCKIVLLLGSVATDPILGEKVSNIAGKWTESESLPNAKIIAAPNPAAALRGTIGEIRRAIERLPKALNGGH